MGKLNRLAYRKLIDENITELEKYMPEHSLEKKHTIDVLNDSINFYYQQPICDSCGDMYCPGCNKNEFDVPDTSDKELKQMVVASRKLLVYGSKKWISIETPPQTNKPVMAYQKSTRDIASQFEIVIVAYDGYNWREFNENIETGELFSPGNYNHLTHWMPLPEPPNN